MHFGGRSYLEPIVQSKTLEVFLFLILPQIALTSPPAIKAMRFDQQWVIKTGHSGLRNSGLGCSD